jgi:hypothetical protein
MADRPLTLAEKLAAARAAGAAKLKDAEPPAEELLENAPEPDDIPDEAKKRSPRRRSPSSIDRSPWRRS